MMKTTKPTSSNPNETNAPGLAYMPGSARRNTENENPIQRIFTACLRVLTLSIIVLSSSVAYAESPDLFIPLPADQQKDINPVQTQHIDQIKQRPTTKSVTLVRIDANALKGDSTRMSLPEAKTLNFSKSNTETRSANDYTWFGALSGVPGKATLVVHDGNITGSIRDNGDLYRVEPVGNGVHAVIKVDQSRFPPEHPPTFKEKEKHSGIAPTPKGGLDTQSRAGPVGIDVLVAYTPAARTAVSDIAATIQLAVAEANQSYINSGINIKLSLVDSFEVSYSETGKSFDTILADFAGNATVNNRRNSSGADMASLIINKSDYCGLANAIMANASNAFDVVYYDCATGYYSFAHEFGHLQGARHDPANDSTTTPFAYGHGFQHTSPAPTWRTIMAYNCSGSSCPRIQYWSNPSINYNGVAMGTAAKNNNARVLNETANTVAGFKTKVSGIWQRFLNPNDKLVTLATGRNLDGRLEVFGAASDNTLWHNWQTAPNNGWSGWQRFLNPNDKLVTLTVGQNKDGRLEVFGAASDKTLWHNWQTAPNNGWSGWQRFLNPNDKLVTLTVGRNLDGRLEVFGAASDNTLWHNWQTAPNNGWSGWQRFLNPNDKLVTLAVGQNKDGRLEVFGAASDKTLWHNWQTAPNNGWSGWQRFLNPNDKLVTLTVGRNLDGRLEVFGAASDNTLWHNWQTAPNNGWSGWQRFLNPNDKLLTLTVGQNKDGRLEVFGAASDNTLWHNWQTAPNNGWSGWNRFFSPQDKLVKLVPGQNQDGRLEVFGRATDLTLWHTWQTAPNNGWNH